MRGIFTSLALLAALSCSAVPARAIEPVVAPSPGASPASPAPSPTAASKKRADASTALVSGSPDVVVKSARYYDTGDDNGNSSGQEIVVVAFTWTNNSGIDTTPRIDHFEFVDASGQISRGIDSGYTALVGISNYAGVVKRGDSHAYTVGFLVPQGDAGEVIYDLSI